MSKEKPESAVVETKTSADVTIVNIDDIQKNGLNVRKTIRDEEIAELAKSMNEVGQINPITLRPKEEKGKKILYIVCGERRFLAAVKLGWKQISAYVKTMTDEEAMDLMIMENLQRVDVNFIEEAEAYQGLIKKRNLKPQDLADKFGKSIGYVLTRLTLNNLIPEIKEMALKEQMPLSQCTHLARLETSLQKEFFKDRIKEHVKEKFYAAPSVNEIREFTVRKSLKLSNAIFDPQDVELLKQAGACITCPKNSLTNEVLFPEFQGQGVCMDRKCFSKKTDIHIGLTVDSIKTNHPDYLFGHTRLWDEDEIARVERFRKSGVEMIDIGDWQKWEQIYRPTMRKISREDYKTKELFEKAKKEVEEIHTKNIEAFEKRINKPEIRTVYCVAGNEGVGKFHYVKAKKTEKPKMDKKSVKEASKETVKAIVEELKSKDKRNNEIAMEKIHEDAVKFIHEKEYGLIKTAITEPEILLFYRLIARHIRGVNDKVKKGIGVTGGYIQSENDLKKILADLSPERINQLIRVYITAHTKDIFSKSPDSSLLLASINEHYPVELDAIKAPHMETLTKRQARIKERIKELEAKKK